MEITELFDKIADLKAEYKKAKHEKGENNRNQSKSW